MKFKFRVDKDDLTIFLIFAAFLLFIVAIAVTNLSSFATTGQLAGINPIPAFYPEYIKSTFAIYFLCLLGLFISVGSYFFEREKGIGFTTEKKDKGYSRWAKEKEIKAELHRVEISQPRSKVAGVPLILNDKEMWVDDSEFHSLVIGATGSGKTQTVVLPQVQSLAKARESMIITDPKGEIYEKTSNMLRAKGYDILLLNFRDPQRGNSWNPMTIPYRMYKNGQQDKAIELLDDLALNILYDDTNKNQDPFWEKTSADYFSGVALGLFEDAKEDEVNINSISLMTTVGEDKYGGSTFIQEYFNSKDPASAAAINASATVTAPSETKGSILSVFRQKVKLFASRENLSEMLSHSDINLEKIGERPTAVFIIIQDEKKTYHSLVTIFLKQVYETLIATAQKHGGKLPVRTNFILDEFANMPPLKDVTTMITAARSRRIRFTMIIQNFAQLDSVYGDKDAETIKGNCGNIIYLITTELKALEEISKMCGEEKSKKDDKTASTPLVTVSDLQRMKQFEVIIMRMRKSPFKTKFTPYFKIDWGKNYARASYPTREKREVHTFDIKAYVRMQKHKKLKEMMKSFEEEEEEEKTPEPIDFSAPNVVPFDKADEDFKEFLSHRGFGKTPSVNEIDTIHETKIEEVPEEKEEVKPFEPGTYKPISSINNENRNTVINNYADEESSDDVADDFDYDYDDLLKKINAKIEELEEEERKEQEEAERKAKEEIVKPIQQQVEVERKIVEPSIENVARLDETVEEPIKNSTPVFNEVKETQRATFENDLDDDDFFDDFFDN